MASYSLVCHTQTIMGLGWHVSYRLHWCIDFSFCVGGRLATESLVELRAHDGPLDIASCVLLFYSYRHVIARGRFPMAFPRDCPKRSYSCSFWAWRDYRRARGGTH